MIDRPRLVADLQRLLQSLEKDLRERCNTIPEVGAPVRHAWDQARAAGRTAHAYEVWREDHLTQAAVAWILACVFVRFLEDNGLVDTPRLAGPGERLALALDHHTVWISRHPTQTDREYLLAVFRDMARLPAMGALLDERHNPLFRLGLSADGARELLAFWQQIAPATGALAHDFSDPGWNTRFLGDLYQDLSESARKTYALLQTPEFVEEFILDRTLEPAIHEFGYQALRLIDPACGSGHFLLGAFRRLFDRRQRDEPATNAPVLAQRTLDALHGVDLNPFAVAIARFRLLMAALEASEARRLADAPGFTINLAVGDSLLHGPRRVAVRGTQRDFYRDRLQHVYDTEDADELRRILGQHYHVVVGNPPYITPKDAALNQAYRDRFGSCHMKYSLAVPFTERFFDLAIAPETGALTPAGFVGMITAKSFMKREFGKKLIEEFMPGWDLTHVVDTSGAFIPGHDTPTVILFARHRRPLAATIRAVLGIRGEPETPADPAKGLVWSAIVAQVGQLGSQSEFVSVADLPRERFHAHPWAIGGGGAAELKQALDDLGSGVLAEMVEGIGFMAISGEDEAFVGPYRFWKRNRTPTHDFGVGDCVRDWRVLPTTKVAFMYQRDDERTSVLPLAELGHFVRVVWPLRTVLRRRLMFGRYPEESGLAWYEYRFFSSERYRVPLSIAFAHIATHNHFVVDRGGKVFKQSAPLIKLPPGASEDDHLGLLGLLNSSTACFWMRQVLHCKGLRGQVAGITAELWEQFYDFDGTKLQRFPVPSRRPLGLTRRLDAAAQALRAALPDIVVASYAPTREKLLSARDRATEVREQMIGLQEELDWHCYRLYGLLKEDFCCPSDDVPRVQVGERAFEIVLARKIAAGEVETKWFERHGSTPITQIPARWPEAYQWLVQRRIEVIESDPNIALIERPEYKRRWNTEQWETQQERALREWLLDRLEDQHHWPDPRLTSCARLSDRVREDGEFMQVAELYRGRADFDVTRLVTELVEEEGVPFLPVLRYTLSGMPKWTVWEECWALQRREDAGEGVGEIPVPPKYVAGDFKRGTYWRLRGKLDVPKERFVLYPHAERDTDQSPVLGWAGWDAFQQARALAAYYVDMKDVEGWSARRLQPLLAGLLELLPWVVQWHNDPDPATGLRMGDYFASFLDEEARALGLTLEDLHRWTPPVGNIRTRSRRSS